jgi:hypothetical protein
MSNHEEPRTTKPSDATEEAIPMADNYSLSTKGAVMAQKRRTWRGSGANDPRRRQKIWISLILLVVGVILFNQFCNNPNADPSGYVWWEGGIGCLFMFGPAALCYFRAFGQAVNTVMTPVPHPTEIELALWKQYGRQPTLQEIAAMQQILIAQRNQELLGAAVLIGGAVAIDHTLHNGGKL